MTTTQSVEFNAQLLKGKLAAARAKSRDSFVSTLPSVPAARGASSETIAGYQARIKELEEALENSLATEQALRSVAEMWQPFMPSMANDAKQATTDLWYLQDTRRDISGFVRWWARGGGYTSNLRAARVFSLDAALAIVAERDTDKAWPISYVESKAALTVDVKNILHSEAILFDRKEWEGGLPSSSLSPRFAR